MCVHISFLCVCVCVLSVDAWKKEPLLLDEPYRGPTSIIGDTLWSTTCDCVRRDVTTTRVGMVYRSVLTDLCAFLFVLYYPLPNGQQYQHQHCTGTSTNTSLAASTSTGIFTGQSYSSRYISLSRVRVCECMCVCVCVYVCVYLYVFVCSDAKI
jgi:hypothetical protein